MIVNSCGDLKLASGMAGKAFQSVPAYRSFLKSRSLTHLAKVPFASLPYTDKKNYCCRWPYLELVPPDHWKDIYFVFRSSGSSGQPFYWPQLKSSYQLFDQQMEMNLRHLFAIHRCPTLAVVGLALGSWIGGDLISGALKNIAVRSPYPLTVFSCGNQHDEILEIISKARHLPQQILIFVCPSAIGHLFMLAQQQKIKLPFSKLRFAVLGEPFTEKMRMDIDQRCGLKFPQVSLASAYGSADTGIIGMESVASIALRRLMQLSETGRAALGVSGPVPNLYHISARDAYIETVHEELLFTRWQGLPLIRYNLHDHGAIFKWTKITSLLKGVKLSKEHEPLRRAVLKHPDLPDLLAIYGRSDRTVFLCGTNVTEAMFRASMEDPQLQKLGTGVFYVSVIEEKQRQRLAWHIELRPGARPSATTEEVFYKVLVRRLGEVQPEFASDYAHIYKKWDQDRSRRIFRFHFYASGTFPRKAGQIKQSIICKDA